MYKNTLSTFFMKRELGEVNTGKRVLNSMAVLKRETIYEWR